MSKKNTTQKAEPEESLRSLSDLSLQITVFICGASLMSFEIIATRFLAPSFGNSIYVWGAVISLFLGSMTIGYALGGKITERYLASTSLPLILIGAGAFILLAPAIQATVCRTFEPLGARMGTLGASLLLFAPASLLIAMVSPIAVHACVAEISKVGTTAGRIYAISAMGSIVGTLVTSFFLIPLLGVAGIAILLAASLFVCAIQTKVLTSGAQAVTPLIFLIAISGAITLGLHQTMAATGPKRVAYFAETPYHNVSVVDTFRDRQLRFDNFVESSIDLKPPYWSTCRYTDTFHLASLLNPDMKSVAFIGAGGGIGPREFKRFYPSLERIDVVDIDPVVLEVCTDYFHLEEDEVTHLHAVDGRQFVRRSDQKWDVVILDAFTIGGQIPFHLATQEYFQEISEKLNPGGVFIMNTNSALEGPLAQVYQSLHPTISKVFPHVYVYAQGYGIGIGTELTRNVIFVGVKAEEAPSIETLLDRAAQFDASHAEGRKDLLGIAEDLIPSEESADFPKGPILTDRFNPIDTYAFRGVLRHGE
ncbi:MAG: fused MFS/spermidine synthase [Candidatus Omnitrophica bacterium]|nr:fused MFS/spermidine synthase [Candidatus Omnitrophota bacterium]MCA9441570.1 fused MFS/spermidine synthase [Candidatus Omnitrophota bacterium]MCB9769133.1 fused MFS/spermidine synthase [Candidatus Omnitrophota bacterium]MCB9784298.1 fused MFS/spermidine synthase [Candidatus Omnitrophota bacterium]